VSLALANYGTNALISHEGGGRFHARNRDSASRFTVSKPPAAPEKAVCAHLAEGLLMFKTPGP
jgi:hypothetical protein